MSDPLRRCIAQLSRFPGIGERTATRLAYWLLRQDPEVAGQIGAAISALPVEACRCSRCFNIAATDPCLTCASPRRSSTIVCVVEQPRDLTSLELTGMHAGVYHVLLGRLDPLDGIGPEGITVADLLARLRDPARNARGVPVKELVLGLNPDMERDTTALHVAEEARSLGIRTTRLARGLPSGSQIEYASRAVLADAISERRQID